MTQVKNSLFDTEKRLGCLIEFLGSQGHAVPLRVLKEGIARYEGAVDWEAFEAQLCAAPKQSGCSSPELSKAERRALDEVFSQWDESRSFETILCVMRNCIGLPAGFVPRPNHVADTGVKLARVLTGLFERFEADLPLLESRALETCLANWSGLTYDEVLEILDNDNDVMMQHIQVGDSQLDMTTAELAAKIRSEFKFFLRHSQSTNSSQRN